MTTQMHYLRPTITVPQLQNGKQQAKSLQSQGMGNNLSQNGRYTFQKSWHKVWNPIM